MQRRLLDYWLDIELQEMLDNDDSHLAGFTREQSVALVKEEIEARNKQRFIVRRKVERRKVYGCARCGGHHEQIEFMAFTNPPHQWTHWGVCPSTLEPILWRMEQTHDG